MPAFAAKYHQGDRTAAVEALIHNGPNVRYVPNNAYADAKLIIAWWVAALARRLPSGMAVYAVSPGGATATAVYAWMQAMEYTSFDYTLDRIERLEREVGQLKEELRQSRDAGPVDAHNGSAAGLEH